MAIKSIIGWMLRLAPLWSIGVNVLIAWLTAKEMVAGKKQTASLGVLVAFCVAMNLLLSCYLLM